MYQHECELMHWAQVTFICAECSFSSFSTDIGGRQTLLWRSHVASMKGIDAHRDLGTAKVPHPSLNMVFFFGEQQHIFYASPEAWTYFQVEDDPMCLWDQGYLSCQLCVSRGVDRRIVRALMLAGGSISAAHEYGGAPQVQAFSQ